MSVTSVNYSDGKLAIRYTGPGAAGFLAGYLSPPVPRETAPLE